MGNYCNSGDGKKSQDDVYKKSEPNTTEDLIEFDCNLKLPLNEDKIQENFKASSPETHDVDPTAQKNITKDAQLTNSCPISPLWSSVKTLPSTLHILYGNPNIITKTPRDPKIVFYIVAPVTGYSDEKELVLHALKALINKYHNIGFEIYICDLHQESLETEKLKWMKNPKEAYGGHDIWTFCSSSISRYVNQCYLVPILLLNSWLGNPTLPLTIETQDFQFIAKTLISTHKEKHKLLSKWYKMDEDSQPSCFRINLEISNDGICKDEMEQLLDMFLEVFTTDLRDAYITTVVEQEINHTVLINNDLSKRCVWIQNLNVENVQNITKSSIACDIDRRVKNIHKNLNAQVPENQIFSAAFVNNSQREQLLTALSASFSNIVENIFDDYKTKVEVHCCTDGVDRRLISELFEVDRSIKCLTQNCANFNSLEKIQTFLQDDSNYVLVLKGSQGSGKTKLIAKIAQNIHSWIPECLLVTRFCKTSSYGWCSNLLIRSIVEQLSVLIRNAPFLEKNVDENNITALHELLKESEYPIVFLIDSFDFAVNHLSSGITWMEKLFVDKVKIIISVTTDPSASINDIESIRELQTLGKFKELPLVCSDELWKDIIIYGSGDIFASKQILKLPEEWKKINHKSLVKAKALYWLAWMGVEHLQEFTDDSLFKNIVDVMEDIFGIEEFTFIITLIIASRSGLQESEIVKLIEQENVLKQGVSRQFWGKFCWLFGPFLEKSSLVKIADEFLKEYFQTKYSTRLSKAHHILYNFFKAQNNYFEHSKIQSVCYNTRKLIELPYQAAVVENVNFSSSEYLCNLEWIQQKISGVGCAEFLNDICLVKESDAPHLQFLKSFINKNYAALNYDGCQLNLLFTHEFRKNGSQLENTSIDKSIIKGWQEFVHNVPIPWLELVNDVNIEADHNIYYDILISSSKDNDFVVSLSQKFQQICVWDVKRNLKKMTLNGLPHPLALCSINNNEVAVLCNREIKVVDLTSGKYKVTLKGVMNQKMPYFAIHDPKHLVCLSRNRMYVNLMNLETGDCVTTFKAGEDRFLNSLLVSGDGRILVCGDETSKPFPLLVWSLTQRKLLYDLRIPHHDFITTLAAITFEGSYVAVVAKELAEPSPNFIVVYDLQSGTLFKKWKPTHNTVALAISQKNMCVIAGLDDANILMWDLITGNCKGTLSGHTAPVTFLLSDTSGNILISGDKDGKDVSIRIWELNTGKNLSVYTPPQKISACTMTPGGEYIILALHGCQDLQILKLNSAGVPDLVNQPQIGNIHNENQVLFLE